MPRAKGPFEVRRCQLLGYTEVVIRVAGDTRQPRILTVHDGFHNVRETAGFFAQCEELYNGLRELLPVVNVCREPLELMLRAKGNVPDQTILAVLEQFDKARAGALLAVAKAESPAQSPEEHVAWSDPSYEELVNAMNEIRRVAGGEPREMGEDSDVEFQCVEDINNIIAILDELRPKALREPAQVELVPTSPVEEDLHGDLDEQTQETDNA